MNKYINKKSLSPLLLYKKYTIEKFFRWDDEVGRSHVKTRTVWKMANYDSIKSCLHSSTQL